MPERKDRKQEPTAAEFGKLRAYLAQNGVSQSEIREAVEDSAGTRGEIADKLRAWLRERPRA